MRFRFLYLDKDGVETKVGSPDELRQCVLDGRIKEETLLYDALSREWGPARVHTAYRAVLDSGEVEVADPEGTAAGLADDGFDEPEGREIALSDEVPDTVGRFLEKRARERREEDERRPTALDDLRLVDESSVWQDDRPPDSTLGSPEGSVPAESPEGLQPSTEAEPPVAEERPAPSPVTVKVNARGGQQRRRRQTLGWVALVVVVGGLVAARGMLGGDGETPSEVGSAIDTGPPPAANPELEAQIREAEGSAFQDMILAMDSLRNVHEVAGGPRDWLSGRYLATASEFSDVAEYWQRYRAYVEELQTRDEELFRRGFVARLERSGLDGAVLSMRLARATEEFRDSGAARDSVYNAMDGMARAALDLHSLLVQREDDITYTPVRPGVVSRDPVLEAVPADTALRSEIWAILDRLFTHMDVVRGGVPGSGAQLSDVALEGIRNTSRR